MQNKKPELDVLDIDSFVPDGCYVLPATPVKHLREAIALVEKLGRPLTEEELKPFMC